MFWLPGGFGGINGAAPALNTKAGALGFIFLVCSYLFASLFVGGVFAPQKKRTMNERIQTAPSQEIRKSSSSATKQL